MLSLLHSSIRNPSNNIPDVISAFQTRVETDDGIFETGCLSAELLRLKALGFLQNTSLLLTPNAYKTSKLYSIVPTGGTGDFSYTRWLDRTRVNASGVIEILDDHIPAINYSSTCPELLLEPSRTNLIRRSEDFNTSPWLKIAGVTVSSDATTAPDGQTTADALLETATNGVHILTQPVTKSAVSGQYVFSIYVKPNNRNWICLRLGDSSSGTNSVQRFFDIANGTIGSTSSGGTGWTLTNSTVEESANGFYRVAITVTSDASTNIVGAILIANADNSIIYNGNTSNGLYLWGAQLEEGANATSYIPTVASTVQRTLDIVNKITGATDLIGQTEGTIYLNAYFLPHTTEREINICDGTTANRIRFHTGINSPNFSIATFSNGGSEVSLFGLSSEQPFKVAICYSQTDVRIFFNGIKMIHDTVNDLPLSMNTIIFNHPVASRQLVNATIKAFALSKVSLSDSEAIALTG